MSKDMVKQVRITADGDIELFLRGVGQFIR